MPKGPKGQRRPADVIANAVKVADRHGRGTDDVIDDGKDPAAKSLGKRGGEARARSLCPNARKRSQSERLRLDGRPECYRDSAGRLPFTSLKTQSKSHSPASFNSSTTFLIGKNCIPG